MSNLSKLFVLAVSRLPLFFLATSIGLAGQTAYAQTVSIFDILVATNNLTVVGTTTIQGSAFSVGTSTLVVKQGKVGIGTTTPQGEFHIFGPVVTSNNSQFLWISSNSALRIGEDPYGFFANANIAQFSYSFGYGQRNTGYNSTISGGAQNTITGISYGSIGGGSSNSVSENSGTVGGGSGNSVASSGGAIAGGVSNRVGETGSVYPYATVGGGNGNHAKARSSVIAGGGDPAFGGNATLGSGSSILGGVVNAVYGDYSTIGGGRFNTVTGAHSTVPGGFGNSAAGDYSFAAGSAATSNHRGAFVWADSQGSVLTSNTTDEFRIRAGGGYVFLSSSSLATVIVSSGALMISTSATAAKAVPNLFISSTNGNVGVGTRLPAGTLDVHGSAQFGPSAGKSTFTASPGGATYALELSSGVTISSGGPINLTSGGFIRFADGSISTTAAAGTGGGGNAVLSATQTFSGINTFTSTVNISSGAVLGVAPSTTPTANALYAESAVKAFIIFTGTGTVTIQSSFNVSSITDNGTGDYTVNFMRPFDGNNYAYSCSGRYDGTTAGWCAQVVGSGSGSMTAGAVRFKTTDTVGGALDWEKALVMFVGRQ